MSYQIMELRLSSDTAKRKRFFTAESFAHPAKMHIGLLEWIVFTFTQEGDVILDPMLGSGTTLYAVLLGRSVIGVELEAKFIKMAEDNLAKLNQMPLYLGTKQRGQAQIIQGDARQLEGLLVDKCIFSPPYAEVKQDDTHKPEGYWDKAGKIGHKPDMTPNNIENIGNLPYGNIDSIITSPPYESTVKHGDEGTSAHGHERPSYEERLANTRGYSESELNIGNLKSTSYLESMALVYSQCYKVLKPQGLMILIVKNFIRNKQEVRLDLDTIKLCEQAGFELVERHYRKLTAQSFWRIIYQQKYPDAPVLDKEDILVFRKD